MLARKNLIPLKREFGEIRKNGKLYDSASFGLLVSYQKTEGTQNHPLCAFIVSKKVDKRSVVRHDVKRKLSDGVSPLLTHLAKNVELVFLAKAKAIAATREELKLEMVMALRRARLLQGI